MTREISLPAGSRAVTVRMFSPSRRASGKEKEPSGATATRIPLAERVAPGSVVPVTRTVGRDVAGPARGPGGGRGGGGGGGGEPRGGASKGDEIVTEGGVVSPAAVTTRGKRSWLSESMTKGTSPIPAAPGRARPGPPH